VHRITIHRRLVDTATPLFLVVTALLLLQGGTAWAPQWVLNLLARSGMDAVPATTLCAASLTAAACTILALRLHLRGSRMLARVSLMGMAFASVAEGAAILAQPPVAGQLQGASTLLWVGVALACSLGLLIGIDRTKPASTGEGTAVLTGRSVALAVVLAIVAVAIVVRMPIADTIELERLSGKGYEPIELDTASWVGRTLPDTGLSQHIPQLTALTLEGDSLVVFYNPHCGHCHELFLEHLGPDRSERIVAIEVPPAKAQVEAAGDDTGDIACDHCQRVSLAAGPMWLVEIPTVVRVRDGIVTCVATKDFERCLNPVAGD